MKKQFKPALRLSDVKNGLQYFSEEEIEQNEEQTEEVEKKTPDQKLFSQEELNKVVAKIRKQESAKAHEAAMKELKLQNMSKEERMMEEMKEMKAELEAAKSVAQRSKLRDYSAKNLREMGIDPAFADFVIGGNEEETSEKLAAFKNQFDRVWSARVKSEIATETPRKADTSVNTANLDPETAAFLKEFNN